MVRKNNWAEDRVSFFIGDRLCSIPAGWTNADPEDPFVVIAAGRSAFRVDDLISLVSLIEGIRASSRDEGVRPTTPLV